MDYSTFNIDWLLEKIERKEMVKYLFFWGHTPSKDGSINKSCFSQWWNKGFEVEGIYYATAEHWMMAQKAKLFNDIEIFQQIISNPSPAVAKKLGRKVHNFNPEVWFNRGFQIVCEGNYYKFTQNRELQEILLLSGNRILVEASPLDKIWGIGLSETDTRAEKPQLWNGKNLLGFALMEVREQIRSENKNMYEGV